MRDIKIGTWAEIPTPYATDIMAKAGLDFSIIDMEHGIIDFTMAQNMVFAAHGRDKQILIRVPLAEEVWTLRALDTGCDGIVFPGVSGMEDIKKIIECSYFAPTGKRGFNPYITAGGYAGVDRTYFEKENERVSVCIILEGIEVFNYLDDIVSCKEIDIVYIGQYDLSMALGIPGSVGDPAVLKIMDEAVRIIHRAGKRAGCMVHSTEEAEKVIRQGFSFIVYKTDSGILYQSMKEFAQEVSGYEIE